MSTASAKSIVIDRVIAAPIDIVWQMWVDPAHFSAWYGPPGARIPVANMDVTVGGKRHLCMEMDTPNGLMQMWFVGEFREVSPTTRLVYSEAMSDEDGNVLSPESMGMPADHPENTEVVVELSEATDGTHLVLTHHGVPADSPGAQGWAMAMEKLDAHVATLS